MVFETFSDVLYEPFALPVYLCFLNNAISVTIVFRYHIM